MTLDEALLRQALEAATGLVDAQRRAEEAKDGYHQAIRRLHLTGASMREIADALDLSHQRVHQIIEATGGTAGWKPRRKTSVDLACTFCGVARSEVACLVAGPGVYICDACVTLARQVVREADQEKRAHLDPLPANTELGCSFCSETVSGTRRLVAGPGVRVCDQCLDFCAEVIAAQTT